MGIRKDAGMKEDKLLDGQVNVNSALTRVISHAAEAYREEDADIDLTARAWVWKGECDYDAEGLGRGQSMWLKDAIKEAMRVPTVVSRIEYETDKGLRFLYWDGISRLWKQKELWKD